LDEEMILNRNIHNITHDRPMVIQKMRKLIRGALDVRNQQLNSFGEQE